MQTSQGPITSSPTIFLPGDHSSPPPPLHGQPEPGGRAFLMMLLPHPNHALKAGFWSPNISCIHPSFQPQSPLPSPSWLSHPSTLPHLRFPLAITSCSSQTAALPGRGNYTWVSVGGRGNTRDTLTVRLTMRKKHMGPSLCPVPLMGQLLPGLPFGVFPPQPRETCSP